MAVDTYYSVLGVPETATQAEIKAAYRNLIKQIHPDTLSSLSPYLRRIAEDRAKEMTEAYSVLSDVGKRRQYDRLIAEHRQQPSPAPSPPPGQSASQTPPGPFCTKCGTPLNAGGFCPGCDKFRKAANAPPPQPATSRGGYNWDPLKRWAGKHPLLILLSFITLASLVSLLLDSSTPSSSQSATAPATDSAPAPGGSYSAYPCDSAQTVSPIDHKPCKTTTTGPIAVTTDNVVKPKLPVKAVGDIFDQVVPDAAPRKKSNPKPAALYAIVTGMYATLDKRCAFLPYDNYGRCGYGPETIARLQRGDRVRVLSPQVRAENGDDIRKVRTEQGWVGWIDSRSIKVEEQ